MQGWVLLQVAHLLVEQQGMGSVVARLAHLSAQVAVVQAAAVGGVA